MVERDAASADGLGLADAIGLLRDELLQARAAGAGSDIQLPVESMTVELAVSAARIAPRISNLLKAIAASPFHFINSIRNPGGRVNRF